MSGLEILRAGPACTIQDGGRYGYLRFGVTPAGPMDWIAYATVNALLANQPDAAAVEIGPAGLSITAGHGSLRVAIAAPGFRVLRNGGAVPSRVVLGLTPEVTVDVLPGRAGLWGYLALEGGVAGTPVMGSHATHLRSGLGPHGARPLIKGDMLSPALPRDGEAGDLGIIEPTSRDTGPIRYMHGPQADLFGPDAHAALAAGTYTISPKSDRMAYRLSGLVLRATNGHDIVSDGIPLGAIQVPGDGQPFVLMADRQPTGGYPKIGTVIRADLPRLAQTRPGQTVRFAAVDCDTAVAALRQAVEDLRSLDRFRRRLRFARSAPGR